MTGMETKRARGKCIAIVLVCQRDSYAFTSSPIGLSALLNFLVTIFLRIN